MSGVRLGAGYIWFLSQFFSRISQSNTNFCWVLQCRYRFRNRQPKTLSLSIQKSVAKIVSLPIQKSAAKNCVAADSKNGGVISALLLFFFLVFTSPVPLFNIMSPWSFTIWGGRVDVIGPINPKVSNGNIFILVPIDYFTKWIEACSYIHVT